MSIILRPLLAAFVNALPKVIVGGSRFWYCGFVNRLFADCDDTLVGFLLIHIFLYSISFHEKCR